MKAFDPEPYAEGIRALNERERAAIAERAAKARLEAERLARAIGAADPEVQAVYLFGSLASGEPTRLDFDIDLALDGGDPYAAMDLAEGSPFSVDIANLRLLPEGVRKHVVSAGLALFRRGLTNPFAG